MKYTTGGAFRIGPLLHVGFGGRKCRRLKKSLYVHSGDSLGMEVCVTKNKHDKRTNSADMRKGSVSSNKSLHSQV